MCFFGIEWTYLALALAFVGLHAYGSVLRYDRLRDFGGAATSVVILFFFWTH